MSDGSYLEKTGREAINQGLADIEQYDDAKLPDDFNFDFLLGDIILAEYDDCNDDNTEIQREGIWINLNMTRNAWRTGIVLQVGDSVNPKITVGSRIMFPNDKGLKGIQITKDGTKRNIVFLNQERIFGGYYPKDN